MPWLKRLKGCRMKIKVVTAVWCHACLLMKKRIKELMKKNPELNFEMIDLDFDEDKLVGLDVGKILPVYFVYRDDVLVKRFVGEKTIDELEREIHAD